MKTCWEPYSMHILIQFLLIPDCEKITSSQFSDLPKVSEWCSHDNSFVTKLFVVVVYCCHTLNTYKKERTSQHIDNEDVLPPMLW